MNALFQSCAVALSSDVKYILIIISETLQQCQTLPCCVAVSLHRSVLRSQLVAQPSSASVDTSLLLMHTDTTSHDQYHSQ